MWAGASSANANSKRLKIERVPQHSDRDPPSPHLDVTPVLLGEPHVVPCVVQLPEAEDVFPESAALERRLGRDLPPVHRG